MKMNSLFPSHVNSLENDISPHNWIDSIVQPLSSDNISHAPTSNIHVSPGVISNDSHPTSNTNLRRC